LVLVSARTQLSRNWDKFNQRPWLNRVFQDFLFFQRTLLLLDWKQPATVILVLEPSPHPAVLLISNSLTAMLWLARARPPLRSPTVPLYKIALVRTAPAVRPKRPRQALALRRDTSTFLEVLTLWRVSPSLNTLRPRNNPLVETRETASSKLLTLVGPVLLLVDAHMCALDQNPTFER
jgi:hypothetical protein